jgi:hypothetical protein
MAVSTCARHSAWFVLVSLSEIWMPKKRLETAAAVLELAADDPMDAIYLSAKALITMNETEAHKVVERLPLDSASITC